MSEGNAVCSVVVVKNRGIKVENERSLYVKCGFVEVV